LFSTHHVDYKIRFFFVDLFTFKDVFIENWKVFDDRTKSIEIYVDSRLIFKLIARRKEIN
jgi:hypothetical protein